MLLVLPCYYYYSTSKFENQWQSQLQGDVFLALHITNVSQLSAVKNSKVELEANESESLQSVIVTLLILIIIIQDTGLN